MKNTNHSNPVLSDSEVFQQGEGYERVAIFNGWDPSAPNLMAQVHIRIDRLPGESFATASVWSKDRTWTEVLRLPVEEFWSWMPGYTRWQGDSTDRATRQLALDVLDQLKKVAPSI